MTGLEIADASVHGRATAASARWCRARSPRLPFPDDRFDFAVCLDVLEHIEDEVRALRELRRVVRPGGTLLVTVPAYQSLWSEHDVINHHKRRYTRATLSAVAAQAGWETEWTTYFNGCLLPARRRTAASRGCASVDEPVSDLELTPLRLNGLLAAPLRLEAWVIGHGWRIPAGLSLMTVLRKGGDRVLTRSAGRGPVGR